MYRRLLALAWITALMFSGCSRLGLVRRSDTPPSPRPTAAQVGDPSATAIDIPSPTPVQASRAPGAPPGDFTKINDFGDVGSASRQLLRPSPFTEVAVEVDFLAGLEPNSNAVANLVATLKRVTGKRIVLEGANQMTPTRSACYSSGDVAASAASRSISSEGRRAAIYVFYLNGYFCDNDKALGAATNATVAAVFPETYRGKGGTDAAVEETVLLHQIGHLLGLVNLSYVGVRPHHDGNGHSKNQNSVMHASAETDFARRTPLAFDADDLADLADLAAGRL